MMPSQTTRNIQSNNVVVVGHIEQETTFRSYNYLYPASGDGAAGRRGGGAAGRQGGRAAGRRGGEAEGESWMIVWIVDVAE